MSRKVISLNLSESSIDRAISELEKFKRDFQKKCDLVLEKLAEFIKDEMQKGFTGAVVDDLTEQSGGKRYADVRCAVSGNPQEGYIISANGQDAVWVEFGAGVYHNGRPGQSPNPYGQGLQFTIGGFGFNGVRETWVFSEDGEKKFTHGTPAGMPMYKAVQRASERAVAIAREVFG